MSSGAGVWLPSEDTQILRAVCAYNEVYVPDDSWETNPYYQPISMYFIYYDNGVDLVRNVTVEYQCVGFEYSYPGFIDLGTHELEPYEHVIIAEVAAPVSNTLYSGIGGAYPTNKCIFTRGTPVGTHCFAFEMEINNGNPVSGGVPIF